MSLSCNIPAELVEDFTAPTFVNTGAIRNTHQHAPRFGHSNDLYYLLEGSSDQQKEYIKGLIASVIAIGCFFLFWVLFVLAFQYLGPYEVGWLSGRVKPLPPQPRNDDPDWNAAWSKAEQAATRKLKLMRIAVCFCGVVIICSACLMSVKGVASLTSSLASGTAAIDISESLATRAIGLLDQAAQQNTRTSAAVDDLMLDLNDICPLQRPDGICVDVGDFSTCNFDGIFESPEIENTLRHFAEAETSGYFQELVKARQNLVEFLGFTADLHETAESFNAVFYIAMVFSLTLTVLCVLIIFGMMCRSSKLMLCLQHCLVMPAFTILVLFSFAFMLTFVMGSMAVADLCYNSPDDKILIILNRFKEQLSPIVVEIASFYINACPADAVPQQISSQISVLLEAGPKLQDFSSVVTASNSTLQQFCGFNGGETLVAATEVASEQLCQIVDFLDSLRLFFQCENWFPLYDVALYQAICYNGTDGFSWVASTQFVLVFFACVLMTLRAAFYDVQIEQDEDEEGKEYGQSQQAVLELDESVEMPYLEKKYSLEEVFQTVDDDSLSPR